MKKQQKIIISILLIIVVAWGIFLVLGKILTPDPIIPEPLSSEEIIARNQNETVYSETLVDIPVKRKEDKTVFCIQSTEDLKTELYIQGKNSFKQFTNSQGVSYRVVTESPRTIYLKNNLNYATDCEWTSIDISDELYAGMEYVATAFDSEIATCETVQEVPDEFKPVSSCKYLKQVSIKEVDVLLKQ